MGLCLHPAQGTGGLKGQHCCGLQTPRWGGPCRIPGAPVQRLGSQGCLRRQEQAGCSLPFHRAWPSWSNEEVPGALEVPLIPWLGP